VVPRERALATIGVKENARTESEGDPRIALEQLHIACQNVRSAKAIVRVDQPKV
jgi:hypothetical protein